MIEEQLPWPHTSREDVLYQKAHEFALKHRKEAFKNGLMVGFFGGCVFTALLFLLGIIR